MTGRIAKGRITEKQVAGIKSRYHIEASLEKAGIKPNIFDTYEQMVKERRLGRKTGHSFYDHK